jgi:hypothetical protein
MHEPSLRLAAVLLLDPSDHTVKGVLAAMGDAIAGQEGVDCVTVNPGPFGNG